MHSPAETKPAEAPPTAQPVALASDADAVAIAMDGGPTDEGGSPVRRAIRFAATTSVLIHGALLIGMAVFKFTVMAHGDETNISTVFADTERFPEQFQQELDTQHVAATTLNFGLTGTNSAWGASSSPSAIRVNRPSASAALGHSIEIARPTPSLPVSAAVATDLGATEVAGAVGVPVSGYAAALDRMTQELMRLLREESLLVVWLFDESGSMKDDQAELKSRVDRVYEELKLLKRLQEERSLSAARRRRQGMLSAVASFGEQFHLQTEFPTDDPAQVIAAIERVPIDETGTENMCQALIAAIAQYRKLVAVQKRKLVLVVVSDEAGDDGQFVEETLEHAESAGASIYFFGRESVFGTPYAYVRWRGANSKTIHVLAIRRGPETPFPELLQFDGFHRRRDANEPLHLSGFGPYEQVRLARETGGIFFHVPIEAAASERQDGHKTDQFLLREYLPDLSARRDYLAERNQSPFRRAIAEIIAVLDASDPGKRELLEIVEETDAFSLNPRKYGPRVGRKIQRALSLLAVLTTAQEKLDRVRPLRAKEPSARWRANFDLMDAQLYAYRVRMFEYAIVLEQFGKSIPRRRLKDPRTYAWDARLGAQELVLPDADQERRFQITGEQLQAEQHAAYEKLVTVIDEHPQTPWARRAEWELRRTFGFQFTEVVPRDVKVAPPAGGGAPSQPAPEEADPPKL